MDKNPTTEEDREVYGGMVVVTYVAIASLFAGVAAALFLLFNI